MAMACSRDGADYLAMRWQYNGNTMAMMVMAKVAMACCSYSTDQAASCWFVTMAMAMAILVMASVAMASVAMVMMETVSIRAM